MNHKINFTNQMTKHIPAPCVRCGRPSKLAELCHLCVDDNKIRKFVVPEGQQLDEHLFPIESQNVLPLTH